MVARRLHDRLAEASSAVRRSLEDQIPELRGDAAARGVARDQRRGNVDTMLYALRYDIAVERVEAPTAALEYARRLAQRGVPVNALVRAYRLGQRRMNELIFAELRAIEIPESMRVPVIEAITGAMFEYIDWMSQQVVGVYEDERERWLENQNSLRGVRVREMLAANKTIDVDAATTSIRYPLRWHHLGLVMWYPEPGTEGDELARSATVSSRTGRSRRCSRQPALRCRRPELWLGMAAVSRRGRRRGDRCRFEDPPVRADPTRLAECGNRDRWPVGVEGFRRSHREAQEARGVAIVSDRRIRDADGDRRHRPRVVRRGAAWWLSKHGGRHPRVGSHRTWRPCGRQRKRRAAA